MTAKLIRVIETHLQLRGEGTEDDPKRLITQYWSEDGQLLAESDPHLIWLPMKDRVEAAFKKLTGEKP